MNTVAEKVAYLNQERLKKNEPENEFETYRSLVAADTLPVNQVLSLRQQAMRKIKLVALRLKFWKDERSLHVTVDPNRPSDMKDATAEANQLRTLLDGKQGSDRRWDRAPRIDPHDSHSAPITLDDFIALLSQSKSALIMLALFLSMLLTPLIASAQQTNLFTNAAPNQPIFGTNSQNGGAYGVFVPLKWETMGTNSTNSYSNGTNYQGQVSTTNLNGNITSGGPYNGGNIFPVGLPNSLNVAIAFTCALSNTNSVSSVIATVQESVGGTDWITLLTLTNTTGASSAAGTVFSASTNVNIGAYSQVRLLQTTDVQLPGTNNVFTNLTFVVACKSGL